MDSRENVTARDSNIWFVVFPGLEDELAEKFYSLEGASDFPSLSPSFGEAIKTESSVKVQSSSSTTALESCTITTPPIIDDTDIRGLILSYFVHHCYEKTALSFHSACATNIQSTEIKTINVPVKSCIKQSSIPQEASIVNPVFTEKQYDSQYASMRRRRELSQLITTGHIQDAIAVLQEQFKSILSCSLLGSEERLTSEEQPSELLFKLYTQRFIENIREGNLKEALHFAQAELVRFGLYDIRQEKPTDVKCHSPKYLDELQDIIALLAYLDPLSSPLAHYMSQIRRDEVSDAVNSAILAKCQLPSSSALEQLLRQLHVVIDFLYDMRLDRDMGASFFKTMKRFRISDILRPPQALLSVSGTTMTTQNVESMNADE